MSDSTLPDLKKTGYSQEEKWAYEQNKRLIERMKAKEKNKEGLGSQRNDPKSDDAASKR